MARNEEKAMSMLNRWTTMKAQERLGGHATRPARPSAVDSVPEAERWRAELVREISRAVTRIQNPYLGEQRTRDLNDQINRLIAEKRRWERRIAELGGPNHAKTSQQQHQQQRQSSAAATAAGGKRPRGPYHYFGEARNLPGVKELLAQTAEPAPEEAEAASDASARQRRRAHPDYFFFRDTSDAVAEAAAEARAGAALDAAWTQRRDGQRAAARELGVPDACADDDDDGLDDAALCAAVDAAIGDVPTEERVAVPSAAAEDDLDQDAAATELARRKEALLARL